MPSSALYRPLESGNGTRSNQTSTGVRPSFSGGNKVRSLWPKTANSRRLFVVVLILMTLLIYVVWSAVLNDADDSRASYGSTTGKSQPNLSFHSTLLVGTATTKVSPIVENIKQQHQASAPPPPPIAPQPPEHGFLVPARVAPLMLEKLLQRAKDNPSLLSSPLTTIATYPTNGSSSVSARDMQNSSSE